MRIFLVLSVVVLSILLVPSITPQVKAQTKNLNLLYINPSQQGPFAAGTTVTYQVKVAEMDPFNAWDIQVSTNANALNPVSITINPNVLQANYSLTPLELTNCVNGGNGFQNGSPGAIGCAPSSGDGPGVVHSAITVLGSDPAVPSISGLLFTVTFTVVDANGVAGVQIFHDSIASSQTQTVQHKTANGIYGSAKLPVVDFYWTPVTPILGQNVTYISNSTDPNPGQSIVTYRYDFGDGNGVHDPGPPNQTTILPVKGGGTPVNSTCGPAYQFSVVLIVTDSLGIQNSRTHTLVTAKTTNPDLSMDSVTVSPDDAVYSGTVLTITATVGDPGTRDETNFNVSISVEHKPIANGFATFNSNTDGGPLVCHHEKDFKFSWSTAGLAPGSYEIEASVSPLRNMNTGQIIESNLNNNVYVHFVRIIVPMGGSLLPFTLPESLGVIAVLVVGIVFARVLISRDQARKRRLSAGLA